MMLSLVGSFLSDTAHKMSRGSSSLDLRESFKDWFAAVVTHKSMDVITDFKSWNVLELDTPKGLEPWAVESRIRS